MKRTLKIFFSLVAGIVIVLVMLPILLAMLLQIGPVQKWAVDAATDFLSEKAGTKFSISKVEIGLFNRAYFEDVYVADKHGDTMIYLKTIDASINGINFFNGKISMGNVTLTDGKVYLRTDSTGLMNVKEVFDHFKPAKPNPNPPNFRMSATQVNLLNTKLLLDDVRKKIQPHGVNYKDMDLRNIDFQAQNVNILNYDIHLAINHLSFDEKSGFHLQHLSSPRCGVNSTGMRYTRLRLETPQTTLVCSHFNLLYQSWWDYNDFVNKVIIDADILPSQIALKTISAFLRQPLNMPIQFELQGKVVGTIPKLTGEIEKLKLLGGSTIQGDFSITGLPDIKNTTFQFNLAQLHTNSQAVDTLLQQITGKPLSPGVRKILDNSGPLTAQGEFYGLLTDFTANSTLTTDAGNIKATLQVKPDSDQAVRMLGNISTMNFNIGKTLNIRPLHLASLSAKVDIRLSNKKAQIKTNATIDRLDYKHYTYGPLTVNGEFINKIFKGSLASTADTNLLFNIDGTFDFTNQDLPSYNFAMNLKQANLVALQVNKRDPISKLAGEINAHFTGTNIDNINGSLAIDSIYYINHIDTVHTSAIYIAANNSAERKNITLNSHFADIRLQGRNSYTNIFGYLAKMAKTYIPAFPEATEIMTGSRQPKLATPPAERTYDDGYYTLDVKVKEANNVASIFLPGVEIAEGTTLDFFFNPAQNKFSLNMSSDYIMRERFYVEHLKIDSRNVADSLSVFLTASEVMTSGISMPNFSILGGIRNNQIHLGARFADNNGSNAALINTTTQILRTPGGLAQIAINLHPSNLRLGGKNWLFSESRVTLDTTGVNIKNFSLRSGKQLFAVNGQLGRTAADTVTLTMSDLDLSPLSLFVENLGYSITGTAGGTIKGVSPLKKLQFYATIDFNDITFGGYDLGNSMLRSTLSSNREKVLLALTTKNGDRPVTGHFNIQDQTYSVGFKFPKFDMVLLEPLLKGILTQTAGSANVDLTLTGGKKTPSIDGHIHLNEYAATVGFTKVRYNFGGEITVKNNRFTLTPTKISDPRGNTGEISAFFDSRYFRDLKFGVSARFSNLLALNTTAVDNPFFYGTGYGTGSVNITGTERSTKLNIVAQTAPGSSVVLPFNNVSTVEQSNFIRFVDPSKKVVVDGDTILSRRPEILKRQEKARYQNELDISIDLQVLPNTSALIQYSNSVMDNIIQGQGRGRLQMHINPSQEIFTIDGPMEIEKGSYRLIIAIADKTFTLQNGGKLLWTGDPANPNVDFTGVYKVPRVSLEPLTGTIGGSTGSATINCGITLTQTLLDPSISFIITAPSATPETQNILRNVLNTEESISMQFFSLFFSGGFLPDMSAAGIGTMSGSVLSTTGIEFLTNQFSSLISNKYFNFKPTFRPRSETSAEEVGFQASVSLLKDKILLEAEGNYATSPTNNNQRTPFSGGGGVTVLLNKAGTLSLKGFTRVIDRFDETQGLQESGIGVYFRQEFQNGADLKRRYEAYLERLRQNAAARKTKRNSEKH